MKFISREKNLTIFFIKTLFLLSLIFFIVKCDIKKESQNKKPECSISTIHIPLGSLSPVMIYNAKNNNESWRLTVLDREQFNELNVEGDLFYTDKFTKESWFISESINEKGFDTLKDAFSLCKNLNSEMKRNKDTIATNKEFEKYRTENLPSFLAKRTNLNSAVGENEDNNKKVKENNEHKNDKSNSTVINENEKNDAKNIDENKLNTKSFLQTGKFY